MIQQVHYDMEDIEKFIEITKESEQEKQSQMLKKLLSVQDKISIIADIDPQELKVIINQLKFIKFKFRDYVINEGDLSRDIFYIMSGKCHVFSGTSKVGSIEAGSTFGEAAAIFNKKRNASVVCASKEVTLLSFGIKHDNMDFCAEALAKIYKNLALQINEKLENMNSNLVKK